MTKSHTDSLTKSIEDLQQFSLSLLRSFPLLRWIGYGLLLLTLFDLIEMFVPLQLMNPVWEFETLGALVERVPVPLIGLVLAFYGEDNYRNRWELPLLKLLSWLTLLAGILFMLLVPLGIIDTLRIDQGHKQQIVAQVDKQMAQIQQVKGQLEKAATKEQMQELLSRINSQARLPDIKDAQELEKVKEQFSSFIAQGEQKIKKEAIQTQSAQRLNLLKKSVKWNLGALISGALFIYIWRSTRWSRRSI